MATTTARIAGKTLTRARVLATVAECDRMGVRSFLDRYGYGRARSWHLRANGRSYPSKAIVGVALGLKAADFFGGVEGAVRALTQLGFTVRSAGQKFEDVKLDVMRRLCKREGLDVSEAAWPRHDVMPTACFLSGSNQPDQITALGFTGSDVGVAAPHVSKVAEARLLALKGTDVQVFVDSGAFSEVKFSKTGERTVVKPMTDADWQKVLGLYDRLAGLGHQLFAVAPDSVGDQDETLARLSRYADRVRALMAKGVRVLVCMQLGALSQADFAGKVDSILGEGWTPAMPCKKAATSPESLAAFIQERAPKHVHLLGLGIRNKQLRKYLDVVADTSVSLDACWIAANAVRKDKKGPRRLIRAADMAREMLPRWGVASVSSVMLSIYCCLVREDGHEVEVKIGEARRGIWSTRNFANAEQVTVKARSCTGRYGDADSTVTYQLNGGVGGNYDLKNEQTFAKGVRRQLQKKADAAERRRQNEIFQKKRDEERASALAVLTNAGIELGRDGKVEVRRANIGTQKFDVRIDGLTAVELVELVQNGLPAWLFCAEESNAG